LVQVAFALAVRSALLVFEAALQFFRGFTRRHAEFRNFV
jgi:hypothetical protein